jgi:O-antigen/teichoic acid export membrane protein
MMKQGGRYVFLLMFPIALALSMFARLGLTLWLGDRFGQYSATIMSWCSIALFFSAIALVPYAAIQGAHRPDIPSKLYLLEAVLYVPALWWLIRRFGVEGAALAFALRTIIETSVFWAAAQRLSPRSELVRYSLGLLAVPTLLLLVGGFVPMNAAGKAIVCTVGLGQWVLVLHQSGILRNGRFQLSQPFA